MQFLTFTALVASAICATAAPSPDVFHVTGFNTLCTESIPQKCVSNFNISLSAYPATRCSVDNNATDYVFCGTIDPEQAYYAYLKASTQKNGPKTFKAKFMTSFPGTPNKDILGSKVLRNPTPVFSFPASKTTTE